jgi:hypothetical protein
MDGWPVGKLEYQGFGKLRRMAASTADTVNTRLERPGDVPSQHGADLRH